MSPGLRPAVARAELACFAALACFCALQWVALVQSPPLLGAAVAVAVATTAGAVLIRLGASGRSAPARWMAVAVVSAAALALAMLLVGLPARLLSPSHWDELGRDVGGGLDGVGSVSVPYDGTDRWTRLAIVLAAPLTVVCAALASFWPGRRRALGRLTGLALLIGLYTTMVAWRTPDTYLGQGVVLLGLVAAWLWAPALDRRGLARVAAAIAVAALAAVPLVALLDSDDPLIDYRSWRLFGAGGISFDWEHSYGPLDWPQRGTLLLAVASDGAHYWKTENLDRFDGVGWSRSEELGPEPFLGKPPSLRPGARTMPATHPWVDRINFEVRGLRSDLIVGAGTTLSVHRVEARPAPDGVWAVGGGVERGDTYTVLAYTPDPSAEQMRGAGSAYPRRAQRYTDLSLPGGSEIQVPFWERRAPAGVEEQLQGTPYERFYALSHKLVAGASTPYDAAASLESQLRSRYLYEQDVPAQEYPLVSFLFEDRRGYCQQFSGAMALMLRMNGIPSRVAAGFAPGGRDPERGTFLVEDLDAHSWVEVYFPGIGWVPFDPTPTAAPAEAQLGEEGGVTTERGAGPAFTGDSEAEQPRPDEAALGRDSRPQPLAEGGGEGSGRRLLALAGAALLALALIGGLLYAGRAVRRRLLDPGRLAAAELAELRSALRRLGWELEPRTTMLQLERRLASAFGREAWLYAVRLRERRFRDATLSPPGTRERRRLRRAMLASAGLRGLLVLPPGGPAPRG